MGQFLFFETKIVPLDKLGGSCYRPSRILGRSAARRRRILDTGEILVVSYKCKKQVIFFLAILIPTKVIASATSAENLLHQQPTRNYHRLFM